jgi:hypothetical protein
MHDASWEDPTTMDVYDDNGVDRSLIRWMLSLSPAERLAVVQSSIDLVERARPVTKSEIYGAR